jgi:isoleucyl-tRNA synthetase
LIRSTSESAGSFLAWEINLRIREDEDSEDSSNSLVKMEEEDSVVSSNSLVSMEEEAEKIKLLLPLRLMTHQRRAQRAVVTSSLNNKPVVTSSHSSPPIATNKHSKRPQILTSSLNSSLQIVMNSLNSNRQTVTSRHQPEMTIPPLVRLRETTTLRPRHLWSLAGTTILPLQYPS